MAQTHWKLPRHLLERVRLEAQAQKRGMNAQMEWILEHHFGISDGAATDAA